MRWPLTRRRKRDPLEWRNDRRERGDLLAIYDYDVDRASVALAAYQAGERRPEPDAPIAEVRRRQFPEAGRPGAWGEDGAGL